MAPTLTSFFLLGLVASALALANNFFLTKYDLEPFQDYRLKVPVLGAGRSQDCKWSKEGEIIDQYKFATEYINMGIEKSSDKEWQCVLRIIKVTEEADNGRMFGLEFKDQMYQVSTYTNGEDIPELESEKSTNKLDEMTQQMLTIVYISAGVFVGGSVVFYGLLNCM